ncbi:unnamed protein product [Closterium sp. NIES-54]
MTMGADVFALYDTVVTRYSSPATSSLGRLLLPYLFPELSAFTTVEDLVSHLLASDTRYRAAVPAEFLDRNPPPMYITLYFIVIRLPDSLRSVRDHFLSFDPTSLTVDLLEQHLLAAETSAVAVGAARGTPRPPFFEGCSPSPLAPSYASAAAADVSVAEDVGAATASAKRRSSKGNGGWGGGGGSSGGGGGSESGGGGSSGGGGGRGTVGGSGGLGGGGGGSGGSGGSGGGGTGSGGTGARRVGSRGGQRLQQQRRSETPSPHQLREWFLHGASGGSCPYFIRTGDRAGQTCGRLHTQHRFISRLDDAWRVEFGDDVELPRWADLLRSRIAIFNLDFDAILSAMYALSVSAAVDCYRCVPPDPGIAAAALGASESGTLPGTAPAEALHTFTLDSGTSCCFFRDSTTLTPLPAPVPVRLADPYGGPVVARSSTVLPCLVVPFGSLSGLHLPSFSTNLVSTAALQDAMVTTTTRGGQSVSICTCTRTGRHLATFTRRPGSGLYTLATEPSQVAASAQLSASGQVAASCSCRTRLFCGTTAWVTPPCHDFVACTLVFLSLVFPCPCLPCRPRLPRPASLASRGGSVPLLTPPRFPRRLLPCTLSTWTFRLQLRERFGQDLLVLRLHSDRGGEFSSNLLRDICRGEGILHLFTLPDSPQQNGIAERRIGLVMEVARTSMIHAAAPHFLWPFVVRYAAHQLNLWPRVSLPETSPTLRWTGEVGDASVFRDVTFDESVPFYCLFPYRSAPLPPAPLFLAPGPPLVDPLPPQGPAPSGVSHVDPLLGLAPVQVAIDSGAARGAVSRGAEPGGVESEGVETGGAKPEGVETGGAETGGAETKGAEPGGVETGGAEPGDVAAGSGEPGDAEPAGVEPGGADSEGAEAGGEEPWGAGGTRVVAGAVGAGGTRVVAGAGVTGGTAATGPGGARIRGTGAAGTSGVEGAGAGDLTESSTTGAGSTGAGGAGVGGPGAGGAGVGGPGVGGPASPLPAPSPYTEQSGGLTERCEPASRPVSPVRTACRVPCSRPPPVPGTHTMTLRLSSVPLRVPLPAPPESSLPEVPDPESDRTRAVSPTVSRLLATAVTDPSFESAAASALVAGMLDFAAACRLDYTTALVAESASATPPSVEGECALGMDVLQARQEDFECLAAAWLSAMDAEMAFKKSTSTYVDKVPPPGAIIVDGMWIFRVKRPPGSPLAFKARYVVRGFSQRQGVDYFQTFSPTPKMTTLRVLLHVAAQREYELHSLDFSTTFLQGSLHEEIWLRRPPSFTESFPAGLHLRLLGLLVLLLPPFYVLVYFDDLIFATADTEAISLVKSKLQKRHTCTDLGELRSYLGLQITRDRAWRTITLTQSHMVHQFSSPQPTPLSTSHSLSAPPLDESVEPSGPYPEHVGCLMYLMTCTRPDLAYPLSLLACYVAPGRHRKVHWDAAKRVLRYLCSTSGMGLVLGGRGPVVLTSHANASWVDDSATQRSSQGYTFSLGSGSVSWRSTRWSSVLSSCCEAEIYTGAMAALELRWLTYLLTNLGERPRSPPVLYVDNKAMIAMCLEHRLEHITKHIALRYFLARELQQRGQLRLEYVATRSKTADIFTKALPLGDHQRFSTVLGPPSRPSCSLCTASCIPLAAPCCCLPCSLCCQAPARPACCAAMASLRVLAFDHEGHPIQFDTWLDNLQLYLLSHSRDNVSLFDHTSGAAPARPTTADSAPRSQWLTRDAAARLAIRNHLP